MAARLRGQVTSSPILPSLSSASVARLQPSHRGRNLPRPTIRTFSTSDAQCADLPQVAEGTVSLYAISDLHTDHHANMAWVQNLPSHKHSASGFSKCSKPDTSVLLVAGDVSDDMGLLRATLEALVEKFHVVSFVPGNHELWVKGEPGSQAAYERNAGATDSVAKLQKILELCRDLGVLTQPAQIGGLWLVPTLAWHHQSWDKEADIPGIPRASAMTVADYAACMWPEDMPGRSNLGSPETAAWFDEANENIQQPGWSKLQEALRTSRQTAAAAAAGAARQQQRRGQKLDVVSFSHFLPHQHLLPEKRFLSYPNLAKAVGSDYLWARMQQLQPDMHVFGHSHFAWDAHIDGIRCIQAPLCYPNERRHRVKSIILQNTPHGSSSSSDGRQQQQQVQNMESHDHHVSNIPWLPVRVYQAQYRADLVTAAAGGLQQGLQEVLMPGSSSSSSDVSILQQHGIPVLHSSQLDLQFQQQHNANQSHNLDFSNSSSSSGSSSSTDASSCYVISDWQASWCPNLFGVWSEYYKVTPREPDSVELAPWVAKRYQKYPRLAQRLAAKNGNS